MKHSPCCGRIEALRAQVDKLTAELSQSQQREEMHRKNYENMQVLCNQLGGLSLTPAAEDNKRLTAERDEARKALEEIARPQEQSFYVVRMDGRVLCAEWSAVQWRMDRAQQYLTRHTPKEPT